MIKGKKSDKFFDMFAGEYVEITTSLKASQEVESEEGYMRTSTHLPIYGFLLEVDDSFYYLGDIPIEVSKAIAKKEVKTVAIFKEPDMMADFLEALPTPTDKKDIN